MSSTKSGSSSQKAPQSANASAALSATSTRITLIRVGHDDEVFAQFLAHRAHDANILIEVEADFDLDAVKALIGETARTLRDFRRLFGIKSRGVDRNFVPALAAQELIKRNTAHFAENIPQRDIDAAQRDDADAARAELFVTAAHVGRIPDLVDLCRVHADQQRL